MNPNARPLNTLVLDSRVEYQFGRMLGRGGYGAVYQGLNIHNGDFVAIKQINLSAIPKDQIGGIMTEIDLLKKLKHENIVKYVGYLKTKEYLNIVLEYVENGSLASIVKSMGRFPESLVRVYITQVLQGLLYLHEQGVVHRDIKGANILSTKKGHVKLADFGVAQEQISAQEDTNCVVGTPYWMAPEIIELAGASPLSDIWSVGCTVIELVTGDPPYFDLAPMPALFRIVQDDHPPIPPQLSPALKDFLMECFQKDPLLRIDARRLLKHPWIRSNAKSEPIPANLEIQNVQENIKQYNEELERTATISITGKLIIPANPKDISSPRNNLKSPRNDLLSPRSKKKRKSKKSKDKEKVKRTASKDKSKSKHKRSKEPKTRKESSGKRKRANSKRDKDIPTLKSDESSKDVDKTATIGNSTKPVAGNRNSVDKKKPLVALKTLPPPKKIVREVIDEGEWDDETQSFIIPEELRQKKKAAKTLPKQNSITTKKGEGSWEESWGDSDSVSAENQKIVSTPVAPVVDEDDWDKDFDLELPSTNNKPKAPPKEATKTINSDEDDWDKDFDLGPTKPSVSKPTKPISKPVGGEEEWSDDWDKDFDLGDVPTKNENSIAPASAKGLPKITNDEGSEDDWDKYFDISLPITPAAPAEEKWSDEEKWSSEDDLAAPADDFGAGLGAFDFSKKLSQITTQQSEATAEELDFDDIFDDEDFMTGTGDNFLAISNEVSFLLQSYSPTESDEFIRGITEQLIDIFRLNPNDKSRLIRHSGAIQILEILEIIAPSIADYALRLINQIVEGNNKIQENLCLVGAIPAVLEFVDNDDNQSSEKSIRLEVAKFVKQVCSGSALTHQMFIACRGLPYLAGFLRTNNYKEDKDLVFMAIDGIQSVFELQSTTPKNDFCRLFVKTDTLLQLSRALLNSLKNKKDFHYAQKILDILLHFSAGDSVVKCNMADASKNGVLKNLIKCLELLRNHEDELVNLLKCIKQLSMDTVSLLPLQQAGAITSLINLFSLEDISTDIVNQLVSALYNLTRIDRGRQEQAVRAGIIPHLMNIIDTNSPLKQFALEIILDLGKIPGGRAELSKMNGVEYYLDLLNNYSNWRVNTFDVLSLWVRDDTKVQEILSQPSNLEKLVSVFISSSKPIFVNIVEPIFRVVQSCNAIQLLLAQNKKFVTCILQGLLGKSFDNLVRLKLMKILVALCDVAPDFPQFAKTHNLGTSLKKLEEDRSILIADLAEKLNNKFLSK